MIRPDELDPGPDCLNQLQLDRVLAGEREGLQATQKHLKRCPICQERVSLLEKERENVFDWDLMDRCVTRVLETDRERTLTMPQIKQAFSQAGKIKWMGLGAFGLLLMGSLVLILLPGTDSKGPYRPPKENFMFVVMVERDGQSLTLSTQDRFEPGDGLGIKVHVPGPGRLWLVRTSAAKEAQWIEHQGKQFWNVSGDGIEFLELDSGVGPTQRDELWIAVYCPHADYVANLLALIDDLTKNSPPAGGHDAPMPDTLGPCALRSVRIRQAD